jgi:hypothetical protein
VKGIKKPMIRFTFGIAGGPTPGSTSYGAMLTL